VNSFTSVSADPPLVLICIDRSCSILHLFQTSPGYVLNFLSEEQQDLSNRFAVLPEGRFQGVAWEPGSATGAPCLDGTIGFMECTVREQIDAGDHIIFLAEVEHGSCSDGNPLLYFASSYRRLA
jgi:flavin reductase (DIM6/NTAB) family NADH-FMN oxidoreductase RutF